MVPLSLITFPLCFCSGTCVGSNRFSEPYLSDVDQLRETDVSKCVWHQRWRFWSRTLPVPPFLTHTCTQVNRFSEPYLTDVDQVRETDVSKCIWHQRWRFWTHTLPVAPLLIHTCTQVHRFSEPYLTDVDQLRETDVSKYVWHQECHNPVYVRCVDSSGLVFESFIVPILIYKSCL